MGASNFPGLKFHKGDHAAVVIAQVRKVRRSRDERESDKVRARAGGRCEISVIGEGRCRRAVAHVHHMIGGRMRGRGFSAMADVKQACCAICHRELTGTIGGKRLERTVDGGPWWTDKYRRVTYQKVK